MPLSPDSAAVAESFDRHRASPHVGVDEYVRLRQLELGGAVLHKRRIYLDKCFWIGLRDVYLNRSDDAAAAQLLESLVSGVLTGRIVCPLSASLFVELMKQTDPVTRYATAKLMDTLSGGLTLIPHEARVSTEVAHLFHERAGYVVYPLEELVWTKVPYVLGLQHPVNRMFPPKEQIVMQKAFFDHLSSITLEEMTKTIGDSWPQDTPFQGIADRLNRSNELHVDQLRSFKGAYRAEFLGVIDLCFPTARQVLARIVAEGRSAEMADLTQDKDLFGFLAAIAMEPSSPRALRTLHIGASLHAAVRWNRGKKFTANDLLDLQHAEAAIAYCDAFLTDRPMYALLTQKHIGLTNDFQCKVMSTNEEGVAWLE